MTSYKRNTVYDETSGFISSEWIRRFFIIYIMRLIGQKELVKIAVEIEISVFMAILSCF